LDFTNDGIPGHVVIAKVVSAERVPRDDGNVLFKIDYLATLLLLHLKTPTHTIAQQQLYLALSSQ